MASHALLRFRSFFVPVIYTVQSRRVRQAWFQWHSSWHPPANIYTGVWRCSKSKLKFSWQCLLHPIHSFICAAVHLANQWPAVAPLSATRSIWIGWDTTSWWYNSIVLLSGICRSSFWMNCSLTQLLSRSCHKPEIFRGQIAPIAPNEPSSPWSAPGSSMVKSSWVKPSSQRFSKYILVPSCTMVFADKRIRTNLYTERKSCKYIWNHKESNLSTSQLFQLNMLQHVLPKDSQQLFSLILPWNRAAPWPSQQGVESAIWSQSSRQWCFMTWCFVYIYIVHICIYIYGFNVWKILKVCFCCP